MRHVLHQNYFAMKRLIYFFAPTLFLCQSLFSQYAVQPNARKVQVAILFDTSNSMDGLIDQAKSRIWSIVNEMSNLRYQGQMPTIEIALYDYGNSTLTAESGYIRQQVALTNDLDVISQKLFALTTNGGDEYCGAVIQKSLQELNWSVNPNDLKMIYIAGNEPFNQGSVPFREVCTTASTRDIFINTIYCGDRDQGIREFWQDCASLSKGDYFNINSDAQVRQIATPYDGDIGIYNDSLNRTYFGYGAMGQAKKSLQQEQDFNASNQAPSVAAERAIVKSKGSYSNSQWDLVDAVDQEGKNIKEMEEAELPEEFKGKTAEQRVEMLDSIRADRARYQAKIGELANKRQAYIAEELKKETTGQEDDFGTSVNNSMLKRAKEIGFETQVP